MVDQDQRKITLICSTRCSNPEKLFARTLKEVVYRGHLQNRGWQCFHAGAVALGSNVFLVIGDANAGKTTLLMALVAQGGTFISNERTYLKRGHDGRMYLLGYPQPINIRISMAQAFPEMIPWIQNSWRLHYKQNFFDPSKINLLDRSGWKKSREKLIVFPHELTQILHGHDHIWGGEIKGILIPDGSQSPCEPTATFLEEPHRLELFQRNRIGTRINGTVRPDWLHLNKADFGRVPKEMLDLPTIQWRYHVREGRILGLDDPMSWLSRKGLHPSSHIRTNKVNLKITSTTRFSKERLPKPSRSQFPDGPPRAPNGMRSYVIGDIHGRLDLLKKIHGKISDELQSLPTGLSSEVIYLGDYIDRGPNSKGVVDLLINEPLENCRSIHLLGNHEARLEKFLSQPILEHRIFRIFIKNGGLETVRSYGIPVKAPISSETRIISIRDRLIQAIPSDHRAFFSGLKLSHSVGDYFLVHAGVRPGRRLDQQEPRDLIKIRRAFYDHHDPFEKVVVHGHSSSSRAIIRHNRIGIDTVKKSGHLTCLVLEAEEKRILTS